MDLRTDSIDEADDGKGTFDDMDLLEEGFLIGEEFKDEVEVPANDVQNKYSHDSSHISHLGTIDDTLINALVNFNNNLSTYKISCEVCGE